MLGPLFKIIWILFTQGCFVPSLVEIGSVILEKKIFFNFINVFSLFRNYLPLEKGRALYLNKTLIPFTQGWFEPVEIGSVVLEKENFWNFVNVFLPFCNYLPLKKSRVLDFNKLESLHPRMLCAKLAQWFWRRRWKFEKFTTTPTTTSTTTTTTTTDNGQILIRKAPFSLWLK